MSSDEVRPDSELIEVPIPVPVPAPLPLIERPHAKRSRWVGVAVVVALVLLTACGAAGFALYSLGDASRRISTERVDPGVTITRDHAWVLAQGTDEWGVPEVFALRVADRRLRTLRGYRLVDVERARDRAWVVADQGDTPGHPSDPAPEPGGWLPTIGDLLDHPGSETEAWDYVEGGEPQYMGKPFYAAEESSAGIGATMVGEYTRGAAPSEIRFSSKGVTRTVEYSRTFAPAGWSRSGRYYATLDLVKDSEWGEMPGTWDARFAKGLAVPVLRIYDGTTAAVVASAPCLFPVARRIGFGWSGLEDRVYWDSLEGGRWTIRSLAPGETATDVVPPAGLDGSQPVLLTGHDSRGVLAVGLPPGAEKAKTTPTPIAFFAIGPGRSVRSLPISTSQGMVAFGPEDGVFIGHPTAEFLAASPFNPGGARFAMRVWYAPTSSSPATLILDTGQRDPAHPNPVKDTP
jgi:hypothetical protein